MKKNACDICQKIIPDSDTEIIEKGFRQLTIDIPDNPRRVINVGIQYRAEVADTKDEAQVCRQCLVRLIKAYKQIRSTGA